METVIRRFLFALLFIPPTLVSAGIVTPGGGISVGQGDGRYVLKTGQTDMTGNYTTTGDITANVFHGSGASLTGLPGGGDATLGGVQTFTGAKTFSAPVTLASSSLTVTGDGEFRSQLRIEKTQAVTDYGSSLITTGTGYYMVVGGREYGDYRKWLIGFGFTSADSAFPPAYIGYQQNFTGSVTKGDLVFGTRPTDANLQAVERMKIQDNGYVGIATGTPQAMLDVNGAVIVRDTTLFKNIPTVQRPGAFGSNFTIDSTLADAGGYGASMIFRSNTSGAVTNSWTLGTNLTANANAFEIYDGSLLRMSMPIAGGVNVPQGAFSVAGATLTVVSGKVGIGIETPAAALHLKSAAVVAQQLRMGNLGNDTNEWAIGREGASTGRLSIYEYPGADIRFTIFPGGNVGIGTSSPSQKLEVWGGVQVSSATLNVGGTNAKIVTSGTLTVGGTFFMAQVAATTIASRVPTAAGGDIKCVDCSTPYTQCTSTGTTAGAWVISNTANHCQ